MDITIKQILEKAEELSASDIHIRAGAVCRYRVNGQLKAVGEERFSPEDIQNLILSVISEHAKKILVKKGEVSFTRSIQGMGRYRIHIFRQQGLYGAVIHMIKGRIPALKELGFPDTVCELIHKKRGLILVTGPSGMGKSTTLAAFLNEMNQKYSYNIVTLENPIEYVHTHGQSIVSQREIGSDTISYKNGLVAALWEDADVIMVGELRDTETISEALIAAENGHLIFSSLHTTGAAATIERLIEMFPAERQQQIRVQLSAVLEAVISQQLIPGMDGESQVAAYEIMHMTPAMKNLIKEGKLHQITQTLKAGYKQGMQTMDDSIYELYEAGKITAQKALEYAQDPFAMERKFE